ncbi:trans-sulfuration enzyme family protein [Granulicella tundricola]|uniref:cysteine-S-conjugate beta-lyase n=1 Tax=Granulicella tundricola (strain ATCC BAA-1859 / DSM 23138 / MP5ACTX9) TaxID=1198114 RepID=E8X6M9_GRATM|nr:PLP-dependent aspartate aminotransferase family protein [Granulicella tundricola]ADW71179.1 Cys/Met metabolism pyridoxal-phosphate-dependent protein [Granulicella tundricola MP5ACTX9]
MKFATKLVHYDVSPGDPFHPMATPIYQTATFEQDFGDSFGPYDYSRSGNPTRRVLEDQLARLENGIRAFCFSSGMAAIATVTRLLKPGDEILADWDLYGGATRLFQQLKDHSGVAVRYVDASNPEILASQISPATRLVYVESPTNPLLRVIDLQASARIAHENGLHLCVDNSTMSPYLQNPLELGADIVIHSATKFLGGHSDVTGGAVVVKDEALAAQIYSVQNAEGTALGPFDCFLLLRGLKTLKLRMDAQQSSAGQIAAQLSEHPKVSRVYYPGLPDHPSSATQKLQARGAGSVISFQAGSPQAAKAIAENLRLFAIAVSFGSVNSTIGIPIKMSHASTPVDLQSSRAIPSDLIRMSIGIEDCGELMQDLDDVLKLI